MKMAFGCYLYVDSAYALGVLGFEFFGDTQQRCE